MKDILDKQDKIIGESALEKDFSVYAEIEYLLDFAEQKLLLHPRDRLVARGRLYLFLGLRGSEELACKLVQPAVFSADVYSRTRVLLDWAAKKQLYNPQSVIETDLFLSNLLGQLMPLASQLEEHFWRLYRNLGTELWESEQGKSIPISGAEQATKFFYQISQDAAYIRNDRLTRNFSWHYNSNEEPDNAIELEITINLSKPEKDPKAIAAAAQQPNQGYPLCALCMENEGYPGHFSWAPRFNHRVVGLKLDGKGFALQYSPYLYYPEHSIVLSKEHRPMVINRATFVELFDFVAQFPHYMVGSNADLTIVGGSILSHHHFQAGRYEFPMFRAPVWFSLYSEKHLTIDVLRWPLSCIRLSSVQTAPLIDWAEHILNNWRAYSDKDIGIYAKTGEMAHNTITPILRQQNGTYELFLVLRNNRCSEEHPLGIFHPHAEIHHIKKENIGLIEVMGLAILPGRLKQEMELMAAYLLSVVHGEEEEAQRLQQEPALCSHLDWLTKLKLSGELPNNRPAMQIFLQNQMALVFAQGLRHCGLFSTYEHWQRFWQSLGLFINGDMATKTKI